MAFKPTVGYIADAFQNSFRQARDQQQRQRELSQRLAEEQRQFGLLQRIREQNAALDTKYKNFLISDKIADNERQDLYNQGMLKAKAGELAYKQEKEEYDRKEAKAKSLLDRAKFGETVRHNQAMEGISKDKNKASNKVKMSSTIAKDIAEIRNPVFKDENNEDIPESDIRYNRESAYERIKLEAFKNNGRAYNFVNNITKMYGRYLKPEELAKEAQKHLMGGGISDEDASDIDNFLNYYEQIYEGLITKPEQ